MIESKYRVGNIDTIIVAQRPKMAPYIEKMKEQISKVLNTSASNINIKATTTEKLGFEGTGEGMAAHSVCSLVPMEE